MRELEALRQGQKAKEAAAAAAASSELLKARQELEAQLRAQASRKE